MPIPPSTSGYAFVGLPNLRNDIYPNISVQQTPSLSQAGKVILITGAGRGIGRAITLQYARASVSTIILLARTGGQLDEVETEIRRISSDVKVLKFAVDVSNEEEVKKCQELVARDVGKLDILINNAGATSDWLPISDTNPEDWWVTMSVNVQGVYLMLHAFLPLLVDTAKKEKTTVDVVNVSSIGANFLIPGASAYQVSKIAVSRLTEFVDLEYKDKGINAVALHPGGVLTDMAKGNEAIAPFLTDTPELCGGFVVWLTKGARTWLGGRYVSATWDVDVLEGMKGEIVDGDKLKCKLVV